MKSNSGAKKRFKLTGGGRIKRAKAFKNHMLTKKTRKKKRALGKKVLVHQSDVARAKRLISG